MPFAEWAEQNVVPPTLLDAAEALTEKWYADGHCWDGKLADIGKKIGVLDASIAREKAKPVRNCDRYKTVMEAWSVFTKMYKATKCEKCQFYNPDDISCHFNWLYAEADKEAL